MHVRTDRRLWGAVWAVVPAPDWMTKGIPRIKMDEYWRSLKANQAVVP